LRVDLNFLKSCLEANGYAVPKNNDTSRPHEGIKDELPIKDFRDVSGKYELLQHAQSTNIALIQQHSFQQVMENIDRIPKFADAPKKYKITHCAIFLADPIYEFAQDKSLNKISLVADWLHHAFDHSKRNRVKRCIEEARSSVTDDDDLEHFLRITGQKIDPTEIIDNPSVYTRKVTDNLEDHVDKVLKHMKITRQEQNLIPVLVKKLLDNEPDEFVRRDMLTVLDPSRSDMQFSELITAVRGIQSRQRSGTRTTTEHVTGTDTIIQSAQVSLRTPYNVPQISTSTTLQCNVKNCENPRHKDENGRAYPFCKPCYTHLVNVGICSAVFVFMARILTIFDVTL
jgi:hypothetical protein